jgi:hypothetical protein
VPEPAAESPSEDRSSEFVSVGQAAKLLAVSDRTARRMAGQLADSDRTPDTGHGRRVRLAAMQALRSEALQQRGKGTSSFHVETTPGQDSDTVSGQWPDSGHGHPVNGRTMAGQHDRLDTSLMAEGSNLLAELATLRAEKEGLLARLADTASDRDAWKDQAGKLDTRLAEALGALQQAQSETRAARALSSRSAMQIEAVSPSDGSQSPPDPSGGTISSPESKKRPVWAFWKKGG